MKLHLTSAVFAAALLCSSAYLAVGQDQAPATAPASSDAKQTAQPESQPSPQQSAPAPQPASPAETQAPAQTSPNSEASPEQQAPAMQNTPPASQPPTEKQKATPAPKPPRLHHTRQRATKKVPAQAPTDTAGKVVIKNGGAKEESAQLTPSVSPQQAQQQRVTITELLAATDANLKQLSSRQLTAEEKSTVDQIHTYVRQSKAASATGDTNRAQTLAYKARLLSEDLAHK